jgi:hypothetical protein
MRNLNGEIQRKRGVFVGHLKGTSADLRQLVAARMRFPQLGTVALIGHVKATGLFLFTHLLPRKGASEDGHGKRKQSHGEADKIAQVNHRLNFSRPACRGERYLLKTRLSAAFPLVLLV